MRRSPCPIACTLDVLGDRWTLLVVRDLLFAGKERFDEFLASPEGIATNVLTERLRRLVDAGLVERTASETHKARGTYQLTPRGESLRPVLRAIGDWGLANLPGTSVEKARALNGKTKR
ncbi:MAG: helix-turn-helix domain-containing protein [Deltaproteobacteria bacterium]|nr:helix-turn-helix domain-containing protein [Deltaproteobacteria bacterium]